MHLLVRAYLQYQPPTKPAPAGEDEQDGGAWMNQAMTATPGPQAARDAQTAAEALAAYERHFFGEVKDVQQL